MRALLFGVLLALAGSAASADPLSTPLTTTATQYSLQGVFINFAAKNVEIRLTLLDSSGTVVQTVTAQATFAQVGFTSIQQTALSTWVIAYLKAQGLIN